jgi:hypothetical protein
MPVDPTASGSSSRSASTSTQWCPGAVWTGPFSTMPPDGAAWTW